MKSLFKSIICSALVLFAMPSFAQTEQMTIHFKNGDKVVYPVTDIEEISYSVIDTPEPVKEVEVGDYYYSDGTWSSGKEAPLADKTCIGIVFCKGLCPEAEDDCEYKLKDGVTPLDEVHGYVVAINNAAESAAWGSWDADGDEGVGTSYDQTDFRGYSNTQAIKAKAEAEAGGLSDDADNNYPAAYYATEVYESTVPAPESSTGWFLPSAFQLKYIYNHNEEFNDNFEKVEGGKAVYGRDAIYWSSSECFKSSLRYWAYMVNLDSSNITPGYISNQAKKKTYEVRSILVF